MFARSKFFRYGLREDILSEKQKTREGGAGAPLPMGERVKETVH